MITKQRNKQKINSKAFSIPILTVSGYVWLDSSQNKDSKCLRINFLLIPLFYDHCLSFSFNLFPFFWSLTYLHTFHFQSLFHFFKIENFPSSSSIIIIYWLNVAILTVHINHLASVITKLTYTYYHMETNFHCPFLDHGHRFLTTTPSVLNMAPPQPTPHPTRGGSLFPTSSSCGQVGWGLYVEVRVVEEYHPPFLALC